MELPDFVRKGGAPMGSVEDFPVGSVLRAKALTVRLVSAWSLAETSREYWEAETGHALREGAHRTLGFEDFDAYLQATIGKDRKQAARRFEAEATKQGKRADFDAASKSSQAGRARENEVGIVTQRYLDRLARDRPDLLERVNAGELKPRTAARLAGIVKVPTRLDRLRRVWALASREEKAAFAGDVVAWVRAQADPAIPQQQRVQDAWDASGRPGEGSRPPAAPDPVE